MPTAETTEALTEQELVERWRAQQLERGGFPEEIADELSTRTDIDLRRAIQMIENGCSPELAAAILR